MTAEAIEIFYVYSRKDDALRKRLDIHLTTLKREGLISTWHDREIRPGMLWEQEINRHLNSADIILLLVSSDFIASDYCYGVEMRRALERHAAGEASVIPIIMRPVDWKRTPFANIRVLPGNGKPVTLWSSRDNALANVVKDIRQTIYHITGRFPDADSSIESRRSKHIHRRLTMEEDSIFLMNYHETLELVKPAVEYGSAYLDMVDEFIQAGEGYGYSDIELARENFAQFVQELEQEAAGIDLPPGCPAQQTYLLLKNSQLVVGEIRFRPALMPPYEKYFGHIGYNIRPSQRGKGYATRQLALLLDEARKLQLPGVSLTIDTENPASVRVIEKNGGKLLQVIENPVKARVILTDNGELQVADVVQTGQKWDLYWIDLT